MAFIIPAPRVSVSPDASPFRLATDARIMLQGGAETAAIAEQLAALLAPATPAPLRIVQGSEPAAGDISLVVGPGAAPDGGDEGYALDVSAGGIRLAAETDAGLFYAMQSLRQLLPVGLERATEPDAAAHRIEVTVAAITIADAPRFAYRGAMLDVARHFRSVDDVVRYLDAMALLKLNHLHLHLTDDQGWRLQIESWPNLTVAGGATSVGGPEHGGFYTADDYRAIVAEAAARHITIVPEIDLPGHTNAALNAYPELNCDGVAPAPYEGVEVGFSSLCASDERAAVTERFLTEVLGEVAALTPGPYLHVGGDESLSTTEADYLDLVRRVTSAGAATGKTVIGWHEMGASRELPDGTIGQYWSYLEPQDDTARLTTSFVEQGGRVILSPADVAYLDIGYPDAPTGPSGTTLGIDWADGYTSFDAAYAWEPSAIVPGIDDAQILGIEAPLWSETTPHMVDVEFLAFPRMFAIAEIAWSPRPGEAGRDRATFAAATAALGERLETLGVAYHRVPEIDWRD